MKTSNHESPVIEEILNLSPRQIQSMTGLRDENDMGTFIDAFVDFAEKEVEEGELEPDASWREAHELFVDSGVRDEILSMMRD